MVRKHGVYHQYYTQENVTSLPSWHTVMRKKDLLHLHKETIRWVVDEQGRMRRMYDQQRTLYQRVLDSGILSTAHTDPEALNPSELN